MSGKLKILIVDDEPLSRKRICSFRLKDCCFEIAGEAEDGREALKKIGEIHPDIVVTDIVMPVMDGLDLLKEIRRRPNPPKVVILTCHEDFDKAQTALRFGAQDYIIKLMLREEDFKKSMQKIADIIFRERKEQKQSVANCIQRLMHAKTQEEIQRDVDRLSAHHFRAACYRLVRLSFPAGLLRRVEEREAENAECRIILAEDDGEFPVCLLWSDGPVSPARFNALTDAFLDRLNREGEASRETGSLKCRALVGVVYHNIATLPAAYCSLLDYENHRFYMKNEDTVCRQTLPVQPFGTYPQDAFLEMMETCRKYCKNGDLDRLGVCWMNWIAEVEKCRPQPETALNMMKMVVSCAANPLSELRMEDQPLDIWMAGSGKQRRWTTRKAALRRRPVSFPAVRAPPR